MRYSIGVDNLVFDWSDFQKDVFNTLRNIILDANPMIEESVKYNVPFYTLNGLLMYVSTLKNDALYLSFCQGDMMLDPAGIFVSDTTKRVRKVVFNPNEKVSWESVTAYVLEAVQINLVERSFSKKKKPN